MNRDKTSDGQPGRMERNAHRRGLFAGHCAQACQDGPGFRLTKHSEFFRFLLRDLLITSANPGGLSKMRREKRFLSAYPAGPRPPQAGGL